MVLAATEVAAAVFLVRVLAVVVVGSERPTTARSTGGGGWAVTLPAFPPRDRVGRLAATSSSVNSRAFVIPYPLHPFIAGCSYRDSRCPRCYATRRSEAPDESWGHARRLAPVIPCPFYVVKRLPSRHFLWADRRIALSLYQAINALRGHARYRAAPRSQPRTARAADPMCDGSNSSHGHPSGPQITMPRRVSIPHRQCSSLPRRCEPFIFRGRSTIGPRRRSYGIAPAAALIPACKIIRACSANRLSGRGDPGGRPPGDLSDAPPLIHLPVCGSAPHYSEAAHT